MPDDRKDKKMSTILITGANRGLGLEFTRQYLKDGETVIATCRAPDGAEALNELASGSGGKVRVERLDVLDDASCAALVGKLKGEAIDMLINNAGIIGPAMEKQSAASMDYDGWAETFAVNAMAPLRVTKALLPNLEAGTGKRVTNVSSRMGSIADTAPNAIAYRSSKAALNMVMKCLSLELADKGFTITVLHPGWVQTDMGGPKADLTPTQSVTGMRAVIAGLTTADNGRFFNFDGKPLPW